MSKIAKRVQDKNKVSKRKRKKRQLDLIVTHQWKKVVVRL